MKRSLVLLVFLVFSNFNTKAQTCPPGPPPSRYNGTTPGTAIAGGRQYDFEYALIGGFDCFERLKAWYPAYLKSTNSISPNHTIVDMAYAVHGTATFSNILVPSNGNYTLTIRYAFAFGLFPGVTDRPEGVRVNGVVVTYDMHFPITYSFDDYDCSSLLVPLRAGRNTIEIFNVSNHGIARADTMLVSNGSPACKDMPPSTAN